MATRRIHEFLVGNKIPFGAINHTCAYTAQEVAELCHVPGRSMTKSVIVRLDGRLAIVVVPATRTVDLERVRRETGSSDVRLADEAEFCGQFDGCQIGTVPPFGNLFGTETLVDRELAREDHIAFNAGTHTNTFVIRYADFARLVRPRLVDVAADQHKNPFKAQRRHHGSRRHRDGFELQTGDSLAAATPTLQAQCGCPIVCHDGAD